METALCALTVFDMVGLIAALIATTDRYRGRHRRTARRV